MAAMTEQYVIEIERDKRMLGALTLFLTYLFKPEAIEGSSVGVIVLDMYIFMNRGADNNGESLPGLYVCMKLAQI